MALCNNCVSGSTLPGNPKGKLEKIGSYETYISTPTSLSSTTTSNDKNVESKQTTSDTTGKAIILFPDVFSLKLVNIKLIADIISERTGITAYVPDVFHGEGFDPETMKIPSSAKEIREKTFIQKLSEKLKMVGAIPWIYQHYPTKKYSETEAFLKALKERYNVQRIGAVGYCYGAKAVVDFNTKGLFDATVVCHPSFTNAASYGNLKAPILFNCAEEDQMFPVKTMEQIRAMLTNNDNSPKHDFKVFIGTAHSFCARPDLGDEAVKKGFEEATARTADWFKSHL